MSDLNRAMTDAAAFWQFLLSEARPLIHTGDEADDRVMKAVHAVQDTVLADPIIANVPDRIAVLENGVVIAFGQHKRRYRDIVAYGPSYPNGWIVWHMEG
jgi:hypothetical protein